MMLSGLSETLLLQHATSRSVRCGRDYHDAGAVISVTRRGSDLTALVAGSRHERYHVQIAIDGSDIVSARCACPYEDGWCKHIVATLFTCLHAPDSVEERPSVTTMLEGRSREELVDLLKSLAAEHPLLLERLEHDYVRKKKTNGSLLKIRGNRSESAFGRGSIRSITCDTPRPTGTSGT